GSAQEKRRRSGSVPRRGSSRRSRKRSRRRSKRCASEATSRRNAPRTRCVPPWIGRSARWRKPGSASISSRVASSNASATRSTTFAAGLRHSKALNPTASSRSRVSRALLATRVVREQRAPGDVPLYRHPEWEERFPWIIQGITGRGDADAPFDLGLSGGQPVGAVLGRWRALREATGMPIAVHARQVHGATVLVHHTAGPSGLVIADDADAHVTRAEGM